MSSNQARIPLLNGKNYDTWKPQMEAILHKNRFLKMAQDEIAVPENPNAKQKHDDTDMDAKADIYVWTRILYEW